ncbi:MAG: hypothetical protein R6V13_03175 [Anaerolineae bacterium]
MSVQKVLDQVFSELTPSHVQEVILRMAEEHRVEGSAGVPFYRIVDGLVGARDLGTGADRWHARMKIKRAVIEMLDQIPEMKYVEGDA